MKTRNFPAGPADWIECRKRSGVSLPAIAAATKICSRYLEAIEAGKFDKLPGDAYTVSYLRQYARAIRYPEDSLVAYYRNSMAPAEPPAASPSRPVPPPAPRTNRLRTLLRSLLPTGYRGILHPRD